MRSLVRLNSQSGNFYKYDSNIGLIRQDGYWSCYRGYSLSNDMPVIIYSFFDCEPSSYVLWKRPDAWFKNFPMQAFNHPQIISPIDYAYKVEEDKRKRFCLIGKMYNGVSLSELMEGHVNGFDGKPIDFAYKMYNLYKLNPTLFAKKVLVEILKVLDFLHGNGITKGCINPDYIFMTDDGQILVSILDYYEWHCLKDTFYQHPNFTSLSLFGALSFKEETLMAPEIKYGLYLNDCRTDVYSAGILFEIMAGYLSYTRNVDNNTVLNKINNKELRNVIKRATERNIEKRYRSIKEFIDNIDDIDGSEKPSSSWFKRVWRSCSFLF